MLRQRNSMPFLAGLGVWLAIAALFLYTNLASAQDDSTSAPLSTPTLSANAIANGIELSWTAVTGAVRYELWTWTSADGWQQIGGSNLSGTTFTHNGVVAGTTYNYAVRSVGATGVMSAWSSYARVAIAAHTATPTP